MTNLGDGTRQAIAASPLTPVLLPARHRINILHILRQLVGAPALAVVLGAEHFAAARHAVDARRVAPVLVDVHHGGVGGDAVIVAAPARARVVAAVERAVLA